MESTIAEQWVMDGDDHEETTGFVVPPNVPLTPSSPDMLNRNEASSPLNARSSRHSQSAQFSPGLFYSEGASNSPSGARSSKHSCRSARASPDVSESRKEISSPAAGSSNHSRKSTRASPDISDKKDPSSPSNDTSSKHGRCGARQVGVSRRKSLESDPITEETVPISISSPEQSFSFEINLPPEADISPLSCKESVIGAMMAKSVDRALENSANFSEIESPRPRNKIRSTAKASPRDRHKGRRRSSDGDEKQDRRRSKRHSDGDDENQHRRRSNESEGYDRERRRRSNESEGFTRKPSNESEGHDRQNGRQSNESDDFSRRRSNESEGHDRQNKRRSNKFEGCDQQNRRRSSESEGYDQPHKRISNESEGYDQQSRRRSNEQDDDEDRQRRRRRRRSGEAGQEKQGRNRSKSNHKDADERRRRRHRSRSQRKDEAERKNRKHRSQSRARSTKTEKQAHLSSEEEFSSESSVDEKRSADSSFHLSDTYGLKAVVAVTTPVVLRGSQSPRRQHIMMPDVKEEGSERALKCTILRGEMDRVNASPVHVVLADVKETSVKRSAKLEEVRGGMERTKASPIRRVLEDGKDTGSKRDSKWEELQRNMKHIKASPVQTRTIPVQTASENNRETSPKQPSKWGAVRNSADLIKETNMATDDSSGRRERSPRRSRTNGDASKWEGLRSGMAFIKATKMRSGESRRRRNNRDGSPRVDEPSPGEGSNIHARTPKRDGTRKKPAETDTGEGSQSRGIRCSGQQAKDASSGGGGSKRSGLRSKLVDTETGEGSQIRGTDSSSQQVNEESAGGDGSEWIGLSSELAEPEAGERSQRRGNRSSSQRRIEASAGGGGSKWSVLKSKLAETETGEGSQRRGARRSDPQVGDASKREASKGANTFIDNAKKQTHESKRRELRRTGGSQVVNEESSGRNLEASKWKALKGANAFINQAKMHREQGQTIRMQLNESPDVNRCTPGSSTSDRPSKWSSLRGGVDALKEVHKQSTGETEKDPKSDSGSANTNQIDDGCHLVQPRIKPVLLSSSNQPSARSGLREGIGSFNSESAKVQDQKTSAQGTHKLPSKWSGLRHAFAFISEAKKKPKGRISGRDTSAPSSDNPGGKTSAAVLTGSKWAGLNKIISETKQRAENSRHRRRSMGNTKVENETKRSAQRSRHRRRSMDDVIEESEQRSPRPAPKVQPPPSIPGNDGCVMVTPKVKPVILGSSLNNTPGGRLSESPSKWAALKKSNDFINNTRRKSKKKNTTRKETAGQAGDEPKPATKPTERMRRMEKESSDSREEQAIPASPSWDGLRNASDLLNEKKKRREDSRARQKSLDSPTPPIKFTQAETLGNGMGGEIQVVPSPLVSLRKPLYSSQWGSVKAAATGIAPKSETETSAASGSISTDPSKWEPLKNQRKDTGKAIDFDASKDINFDASREIDNFNVSREIEFNASKDIEIDMDDDVSKLTGLLQNGIETNETSGEPPSRWSVLKVQMVPDREVDTDTTDTNRESKVKKDIQVSGLKNELETKGTPSRWNVLKAQMESNKDSVTGHANNDNESEHKKESQVSMFRGLKKNGMDTKEASGKTGRPSHWDVLKTQMLESNEASGAAGSRHGRRAASKWNGLKGGMAFINKTKKLAEEKQKKSSTSATTGKRSLWDGLKKAETMGEGGDGLQNHIQSNPTAAALKGSSVSSGERQSVSSEERRSKQVSKWAGLKNGMGFIIKAKQRSEERKAQQLG